MNTVLILTGRYLPGYKDGGPVRSLLNLSEWMGDEVNIKIMCLDRDHGDTSPYPNVSINEWNTVGKAKVFYTPKFTKEEIEKQAQQADVVYSCGPYSDYAIMAMLLKKAGKIKAPLYIASMGSFSPDAYAIKGTKKKLFVLAMKLFGLFKRVIWSVTSNREEEELKAIIGKNAKCVIAEDLARKGTTPRNHNKIDDELKVLFLSRISRKKNLSVVPDILNRIDKNHRVCIDIYGIAEDKDYLNECMDKFRMLPSNIIWEYKGEINSEGVPGVFADYDAFLFPTLGENYGHVIAESLAAGCVPVISDRTPWLDLDKNGCGFVCSLENLDTFANAIDSLVATDSSKYMEIVKSCYTYIENKNQDSVNNSGYRKIFCD